MSTEPEVVAELVDARGTYGVIVLGKMEGDIGVDLQFKGITLGYEDLARILATAAARLMAMAEEAGS